MFIIGLFLFIFALTIKGILTILKYLLFVLVGCSQLIAQERLDTFDIPTVEVKVTKLKTDNPPYAASVINIANNTYQSTSINELTNQFSGLFSLSPNNFAQDTRLSSRGFGARSAFGVRGIKIITDDLPDSSPDGQAQLDNIDFASIKKIELLRGPHAGMYGNNSGGVLNIYTTDLDKPTSIEASYKIGSYNFNQLRLVGNLNREKIKACVTYNNTNVKGFREWSEFKNNIINGIIRYDINKSSSLKLIINFLESPIANDAGAVNLGELSKGRALARDKNLQYKAGESVSQSKFGLVYKLNFKNQSQLIVKNYYIDRAFNNKLPFTSSGAVNINRSLYGNSIEYLFNFKISKIAFINQIGLEHDNQNDRRVLSKNLNGTVGSDPGIYPQNEIFINKAAYFLTNINWNSKWSTNINVRYDNITTKVESPSILTEGSNKKIDNINYSFSLNYKANKNTSIAAIKSTGFESPTLNELSNNPNSQSGFNTNLYPMTSDNSELNIKGRFSNKLVAQFSVFHIASKNEITAYELAGQNGRSYYRNAGSTERNGLELEIKWQISDILSATSNYTYSDFKYGNFLTFNNNNLPGLPKHMAFVNMQVSPLKNLNISLENKYISSIFLNDANTDKSEAYIETNLRTKYEFTKTKYQVDIFGGLNNLLNQNYYSNLRINATGGRYYEAAPGRNFYLGLGIKL